VIDAALQYAGRGWHIVPMRHNKHFYTSDGVKIATRDPKIVQRWWWAEAFGLACGALSGVDVLDIDDASACPLDVGALVESTLTAATPRGGYHLFLRHAGLCSRSFDWGEWRSTGLAIVLPPAPGRSWLNNLMPCEAPAKLLELVRRPTESEIAPATSFSGPLMGTAETTELPKALYRKFLRLVPLSDRVTRHDQRRVIGILNIALQRQHHRNDGLNIAGFCLRELIGDGTISAAAAEELLFDVAMLNGYVAKDGVAAARATIRSGLGIH
jgi:Bifunctional DNA primase/polymerase, N-terminal